MAFCSNCHTENEEMAVFCLKCGETLESSEEIIEMKSKLPNVLIMFLRLIMWAGSAFAILVGFVFVLFGGISEGLSSILIIIWIFGAGIFLNELAYSLPDYNPKVLEGKRETKYGFTENRKKKVLILLILLFITGGWALLIDR